MYYMCSAHILKYFMFILFWWCLVPGTRSLLRIPVASIPVASSPSPSLHHSFAHTLFFVHRRYRAPNLYLYCTNLLPVAIIKTCPQCFCSQYMCRYSLLFGFNNGSECDDFLFAIGKFNGKGNNGFKM